MINPCSNDSPHPAPGRKYPEILGFLVAWLEKRHVGSQELDLLVPTHANKWLRPQIDERLAALNPTRPIEADLHRRVSQAIALFEAIHSGTYERPRNWPDLEPWLNRALAYFIKNGDAIPDHFEDGFEDDQREFAEMGRHLGCLLDHFEAWRQHRDDRTDP